MLRRRTLQSTALAASHTISSSMSLPMGQLVQHTKEKYKCCSLHATQSALVAAYMLTSGIWEDIAEQEDMREDFVCYEASPPGEPLRCAWHLYWTSPTSTSSCSLLAYRSQKPAAYPSCALMSSGAEEALHLQRFHLLSYAGFLLAQCPYRHVLLHMQWPSVVRSFLRPRQLRDAKGMQAPPLWKLLFWPTDMSCSGQAVSLLCAR